MQIKPDLYVVTGAGGNSTVRVTKVGIILVDTKNLGENFYNELIAQIKTVSDKPVKEVIITHVHQDHSGNTGRFIAAGARVTANQGEKAELATYTSPAGKEAAPAAGGKEGKAFLATPARETQGQFSPDVMLPGLRSRWTIPFSCAASVSIAPKTLRRYNTGCALNLLIVRT